MEIHKIMNKVDYRILNIGIPKIGSGMVVSGFMFRPANGSEITYCISYISFCILISFHFKLQYMSKSPTKLPIPTVNPPKPRVTPIPIRPQPIPIRPQPNPNPNPQQIPMPQTRPNLTPINNNPIYNSIKENSPEMKFIISIGMDKPTWNNLLQFIPYLNDFIDCYSFFIVFVYY